MVLEINVKQVAERRMAGETLVLLDVREAEELKTVSIEGDDVVWLAMSELANEQLDAIPDVLQDKTQEIIVFCHHGNRSLQVAGWLEQQGWENVHNMTGGIDDWAMHVDPSIGRY